VNLRGYKTAPPLAVRRGGELIWLSVLPRLQLQLSEARAVSIFRSHRCRPVGSFFELLRQAASLAVASGDDLGELLAALSAAEVAALFAAWEKHQGRAGEVAKPAAMAEETRKRVNDDADVLSDGGAAYQAQSPGAFYGKPVVELTEAQLDYYAAVRSAFIEFYVERDKRREVSKQWLQSPSV